MNAPNMIDIARVELLLGELRLPGVKLMWAFSSRCRATLGHQARFPPYPVMLELTLIATATRMQQERLTASEYKEGVSQYRLNPNQMHCMSSASTLDRPWKGRIPSDWPQRAWICRAT